MLNTETMYMEIANQVILFGCGFCILRALEFSIEKGSHHFHHVIFNLFNIFILFGISMYITGMMRLYPALSFLFPTCLFLSGPLNLLFYQQILDPKKPTPSAIWAHLLPAFVAFLVEIIFQMQPPDFKRQMLSSFFDNPCAHVLTFPFAILVVHAVVYYSVIVKTILSDADSKETRLAMRYILIVAAVIIISIGLLFSGFVLRLPVLFATGGVLITFVHLSYYIGQRILPSSFLTLKSRIRKKRYDRYMLSRGDDEIIRNRLVYLMEEEKIFLDEGISLNSVAEKLSIKPYRLSRLLGSVFRTGFWELINKYRIEEAARIIKEDPAANILSICYRTGFNSKSSFNTAFKKFTGITPSEYKNRVIKTLSGSPESMYTGARRGPSRRNQK